MTIWRAFYLGRSASLGRATTTAFVSGVEHDVVVFARYQPSSREAEPG